MKKISIIILSIFVVVTLFTACNKTQTNDGQDIVNPTKQPTEQAITPTSSPTQSPAENPVDALVGEWEEVDGTSIMELSEDGKVYDSGQYVANYEIIDDTTVKIITSSEEVTINYELVDDSLKWGTNFESCQEFTRKNNE